MNNFIDYPIIDLMVSSAKQIATELQQNILTNEHVLLSIIRYPILKKIFIDYGIEIEKMEFEIRDYLLKQNLFLNHIEFDTTNDFISLFQNIVNNARIDPSTGNKTITLFDFFNELKKFENSHAKYFIEKYGIDLGKIQAFIENNNQHTAATMNSTEVLNTFCVNLNERAKNNQIDMVIGRKTELKSIAHTLCKKKKSNIILVGPPGVGKTQIVEGLAFNIVQGQVPTFLKDKIIYSLDIGSILAGCRYRGDFEEKIKIIIEQIVKNKNAILFIDEAQQINAGGGSNGPGVDFATMLKPELSRGRIKVIAATTWEDYRKTFEKDLALMRRFRAISVTEPSISESIAILTGLKNNYQKFHGGEITVEAIKAAVELSHQYQTDKHLPDKAIDILDSACARKVVEEEKNWVLTAWDIKKEIEEITGIPIVEATKNNNSDILKLEDKLNNSVFNQPTAISELVKPIIVNNAGLKKANKPIASFILHGPSGVGKTLSAQTLSNELGMKLIRYDMSEFQEKHSLARLIGAPPGYVGFGNGDVGDGQLINDINKNPNSVILFDEIEKSHPDISNIMLQMIDYGIVSNSSGKSVNCRNCIIILTTNLGSKESRKSNFGFNKEKTGQTESQKAINSFFLTELRGRVTAIVEYNNLDRKNLRRIVVKEIEEIGKMLIDRNIQIVAGDKLINHILDQSKSSEYGARDISKTSEKILSYPLSMELLSGKISDNTIVEIDYQDKLIFKSINLNLISNIAEVKNLINN